MMGTEYENEEFKGQKIVRSAASVIRILVIAYATNAVVYLIGFFLFLGQVIEDPHPVSLKNAFLLFRSLKTPIVSGYIALQLHGTNVQFHHILETKKLEVDSGLKGLDKLTKGLNKLKMPLFVGAVLHLIQYYENFSSLEES